ncbi:hypothetical protein AAFF_G00287470 [Aldrovandia affinis]|uniref:Cadherin domain-containing protein n=1 Tax=Aldrovandia affinis TaxID=143900 RepID=A0AAD7SR34_9TELE|nr:hypothetical protein AAFF_G00287470 [Aldrovandia affinis]
MKKILLVRNQHHPHDFHHGGDRIHQRGGDQRQLRGSDQHLGQGLGANGQVHCTLYGHDHFKLQQAYEDSYMIVTTAPLDRERIAEYNLTVVAEDLGSPPFRTITQYTIRLSDENDNVPLFSKPVYEVSVVENNAPGAYITTVVARDLDLGYNGKVVYKLSDTHVMGSPASAVVSLDPATGSVYALRSFNYEVMKQLEIRIQASDGGLPALHSSAVIHLKIADQNDNAPSITQPILNNGSAEVLLPKDAPSGYIVTQIKARDADEGSNAELSYTIAKGEDLFSINKVTGQIYLNREIHSSVNESLNITHNSQEDPIQWDMSVIIIVLLAGSCSLLLLAIILIATTCNRRKRQKDSGGFPDEVDIPQLERAKNNSDTLISSHGASAFDAPPYSSFPHSSTAGGDMCEQDSQPTRVYEPENRIRGGKFEGYSTLPGYGKEAVRPITIWKGNSYTTISARDPQFSGKDSGKGDSDFNDSDSDISGDGIKKDCPPVGLQSGLWACTSECKVLGHSDQCWNPSAVSSSANPSHGQQLSSLDKTTSLPRDNYYQAHIPKTVGLQSVYEKALHRDHDYVLVSTPRPLRVQEMDEITVPVYAAPPTRCPTNHI